MQKKEVKAVLFDLDGVLVDSFDAWFHTFNDGLKTFGLRTLSKEEFSKDFGAPIESDMKKYFIGKTIKKVKNMHNSNFVKWKNRVKLFPESKITLKKLKKEKIKLGLISNSTKFIVNLILKHNKIKNYFDVIMTLEDVKKRKPAPDMIILACKKLKIKPENAILVGDTKNDMLAGKRAGCITVGYRIKGEYKIDNLNEILNMLSTENRKF